MRRAPARSAIGSMRPSTWAGTPESMVLGRGAQALGPVLRARGRGCRRCRPMRRPSRRRASSKSPTTSRLRRLAARRGVGARAPRRARRRRRPTRRSSSSTRWRCRNVDEARGLAGLHARDERREHARAGAPRDVEARHRVAVADGVVAAALGPADDGEEARRPSRAARRASRRRRTRGTPRPSGGPTRPRRGRTRRCRPSPAWRARASPSRPCAAARASR